MANVCALLYPNVNDKYGKGNFNYAEEFFKCCELAAILKDEITYDNVSKREQLDLILFIF